MQAIDRKKIDRVLGDMGIDNIAQATIRQCVAVSNALESLTGEKFIHLEIGSPSIPASKIGIDAEKAALDRGVASVYPAISGEPVLKETASKFIKAFVDVNINPRGIIPTVGSMQGGYNLLLECSQLNTKKDTILYIDPGFPVQHTQAEVLGIKSKGFDIYKYRGEKLRAKLESYLCKGNICAILYSNPNNPAWVCLTPAELKIIGGLATKYDVIVLEDLAYFCMDFRNDKSKPFEPPFQPSIAKYTDNYVLMISSSKMFSYAGERIAIVAISDKLYGREYPNLKRRYHIARFGDSFSLVYLYTASSGTSHAPQFALAAMMKASIEGKYNFVKTTAEYGRRAKLAKEIFERHGFSIVYPKDLDTNIADGFFFTAGYGRMDSRTLLMELMRCGIIAIALDTTGSKQYGMRVCVSLLAPDSIFKTLDERLGIFENLQKNKK